MVELEVVQNQRARPIVHELGAAVEVAGVVLVRLHHEKGLFTQTGGLREVERRAADQVARRQLCLIQNPGEHTCRGGFAVRARDGQHPAVVEDFIAQPGGAGGVAQTALENVFHCRVTPGQPCVADHHQVRRRFELCGIKSFVHRDAGRRQQIAHGRIQGLIAAADAIALLLGELGQAAHQRAADAEKVDVPRQVIAA